jgi:hypothetical protein
MSIVCMLTLVVSKWHLGRDLMLVLGFIEIEPCDAMSRA